MAGALQYAEDTYWKVLLWKDRAAVAPMQTWKDSLHLTKEKMLHTQYQNFVPLSVSDEAEAGPAGEQPARNNLTDWNGQGAPTSPSKNDDHSKNAMP
ncbi:hypothetical protein WJR50_30555 [Catalinimonas sp. 4WD22]|uniref:hypothetical protein n=1 Tax=Catalinimonas locisalis TaxID=3133978 RepID=UPI00310153C8